MRAYDLVPAATPSPAPSPAGGFFAPERYSGHWLWLGVGLLALVALWYVFVWWWTTPRRPRRVALTGDRLARLRARYVEQIDAVVRRVERGDQEPRTGHQQLSVLVRHFVQEATGTRASTMTLTDLNRSGDAALRPVAQVVAELYPGEFGRRGDDVASVVAAAARAREVVQTWT